MGNEIGRSGGDGSGRSKSASSSALARGPTPHRVDPEYCWATAYWTVQHENDAETGVPRTVYKSNPTANFAGETVVQRLSNVSFERDVEFFLKDKFGDIGGLLIVI